MALQKREGNIIYLSVADGKIRQKVKEETQDTTKRVVELSDGTTKTMIEKVYDSIDGHMTSIRIVDGKFGRQWLIRIVDGIENFSLQINYDNRYARSLLERLPSINLSEPISIKPYKFTPDDKEKEIIGITVSQKNKEGEWSKVPSYFHEYDKDGGFVGFKNNIPHNETGKMLDKDDWQILLISIMKFFRSMVEVEIQPNLALIYPIENVGGGTQETQTTFQQEEKPTPKKEDPVTETNDLPFIWLLLIGLSSFALYF